MTPLKARLAVLGIFLAGFVAGAATLQLVRVRAENRIFRAPDALAQLIVHGLDRELDLTEGQRRIVHDTVLASRSRLLALRKELVPALVTTFEEGQAHIRTALTPAQRDKFDALVNERRRLLEEALRQVEKEKP